MIREINPAIQSHSKPSSAVETQSMISLEHVTKLYGTVLGVGDLHVDLPKGAYALLGKNGAGKTTLINLLVGQLSPTRGCVRVFGEKTWQNRKLLKRIGLCPAVDVLYPNVTARQWVTHLANLSLMDPSEIDDRVEVALQRVALGKAADRTMGTYSLGMRQRAKLAQAIVHDPELLILDEPFNGIDPIGRAEMMDMLKAWVQEGRSLIIASHVLHEVDAVTDAFMLIFGGRMLAMGNADEIRSLAVGGPRTIEMKGTHLRGLAANLMALPSVTEISLSEQEDSLVVAANDAVEVLMEVASACSTQGSSVSELRGGGGDLEALFDRLIAAQSGQTMLSTSSRDARTSFDSGV